MSENTGTRDSEFRPRDDGSPEGINIEADDKIHSLDCKLLPQVSDLKEIVSLDQKKDGFIEAGKSTTSAHAHVYYQSSDNNLDSASIDAIANNNATSTNDESQNTKSPTNSCGTRADDSMKGDLVSTNKDKQNPPQDETLRPGPSVPVMSYSLSADSSSSVGLNEYIRSPEVQNAIVERSPGGRYVRFMEKLGSGASKDVFRAYDTQEGIEVAWNVVSLTGVPKQERNRIVNEVRLLERLHHQNIISFHGSWVNRERQEVNFVTEILSSGTLKSFIKKVQVIRWKIAKRWAFQILNGLDYLHSQDPPVIHRDLKCENIFINGTSGDLRIGDLGLSTVHRNGKVLSVLGTPEFMAPDMYEETSYDEKVDVYAFGMCLLEIFTKEIPYAECKNPAQIYKKVSSGEPPEVLSRLQSKHARDFVVLCLGFKNDEGKYIRPSVAELLLHPFLLKRPTDDDEVVVDPPFRERTISEVPENSSEQMSQQQSRLQQSTEASTSEKGLVTIVKANKRSTSVDTVDDTEGDTFDNMQESEIVMNKVKVLMGRGQELEEVEQIKQEQSQATVVDSSSQQAFVTGTRGNSFAERDPQTQAALHRNSSANESHSVFSQSMDLQQQHTTNTVLGHLSHDSGAPPQQPTPSMQQFSPPVNAEQQMGLNQISPSKSMLHESQSQIQSTVNPVLKSDSSMQNQAGRDTNGNLPISMQNTQPQVVRELNPSASATVQNTQHYMISDINPNAAAQIHNTPHQVVRDVNSNITAPPQSNYLVAAAVFEQENPNVRPYADDILELVVTLPVDGQTQYVQFKFHLVEDDPVQVAKEMVEDLGIPHGAILEISETISGLARSARMKQDKYTSRLQQNVQNHMHQQFATTGLHPNQHVIGQSSNLDQPSIQHQSLNPNMQQVQHQSITINGRAQEQSNYQINSSQTTQRMSMTNGNSSVAEAFTVQNSQSISHAMGEQGNIHVPPDFPSYSGEPAKNSGFGHQQTQRKSIGSAVEHPIHHSRSQSVHQQFPALAQNGNSPHQYLQQGAHQGMTQSGMSVAMESGHSYQQTSNDLKFYPPNSVLQHSNKGQQHLSNISSVSGGVPQYHYQSAVNVFSSATTDYPPIGSSNSGAFENVEQIQANPSDQIQTNISYSFPVNVDEAKNSVAHHHVKSATLDSTFLQPSNGPFSQHLAAGELMSTAQLQQFRDITYGSTQTGAFNPSPTSVEIAMPSKNVTSNAIPPQQNYNIQQNAPLSHGENRTGSVGLALNEGASYSVVTSNTAMPPMAPMGQVNTVYSQPQSVGTVANKVDPSLDTFNVQKLAEMESISDASVYSQQESVTVNHSKQFAYQGALSIEVVPSEQHVGNDSLLSADDADDISDDEIIDEVRKLDEEFQRNLQRANKVFINRMDNLQRSQIEREAQHQKTLERHQKEQAEYEKRRAQEEEQQNKRIEQLQREWGKKKESIVLSKRKSQQNKSVNGIHIQNSDTAIATTTGTSSETGQELTSVTDSQPEGAA